MSDSPAATPAAEEGQGAGPPWSMLEAGGALVAEALRLEGLCERGEIRMSGRAGTLPVLSPRSNRELGMAGSSGLPNEMSPQDQSSQA